MLDNAYKASELYVSKAFNKVKALSLKEIDGYVTTNVYRLELEADDKSIVLYAKESSDLNNVEFNNSIENEYLNSQYVYDNFFCTNKLSCVKPVCFDKNRHVFFMEEINGLRLDSYIKKLLWFRKKKELDYVIGLCNEWLENFQKIKPVVTSSEKKFEELEANKIEFVYVKCLDNCPDKDKDKFSFLFEKLKKLLVVLNVSTVDITCKHNDYAPWNIMISESSITVYDFADLTNDYKLYDVFYFLHSLKKISIKVPFSKSLINRNIECVVDDLSVSKEFIDYYEIYFNLIDVELYLRKIKQGGKKVFLYKILYRMKLKFILELCSKIK